MYIFLSILIAQHATSVNKVVNALLYPFDKNVCLYNYLLELSHFAQSHLPETSVIIWVQPVANIAGLQFECGGRRSRSGIGNDVGGSSSVYKIYWSAEAMRSVSLACPVVCSVSVSVVQYPLPEMGRKGAVCSRCM